MTRDTGCPFPGPSRRIPGPSPSARGGAPRCADGKPVRAWTSTPRQRAKKIRGGS